MKRLLACLALALTVVIPALGLAPAMAPAVHAQDSAKPATEFATFAAGCYWCVESDFDAVKGVTATESGFMGGKSANPTYEQVSTGTTGHVEVVRISYDPKVVTYDALLAHYWVNVDPTDMRGQFCDRGSQYRPAIFTHNAEQKDKATATWQKINDSKKFDTPIVVTIQDASAFTAAHDQDFYKTNSVRYKYYRAGCGRDARLKQLWGGQAAY